MNTDRLLKPLSALNEAPYIGQILVTFGYTFLSVFIAFGISVFAPVELMSLIATSYLTGSFCIFLIANHLVYWKRKEELFN